MTSRWLPFIFPYKINLPTGLLTIPGNPHFHGYQRSSTTVRSLGQNSAGTQALFVALAANSLHVSIAVHTFKE